MYRLNQDARELTECRKLKVKEADSGGQRSKKLLIKINDKCYIYVLINLSDDHVLQCPTNRY